MTSEQRRYALDTHVLYWYLWDPSRLSPAANGAFRDLEDGNGLGVVPAIVLVELHRLVRKRGRPQSMASLLLTLDRAPALLLDPVTRRHLSAYDSLESVREAHDRLIAAAALVHNCPLVTRDNELRACTAIETIW